MLNPKDGRVHQLYVKLQNIDTKGSNLTKAKHLQSQLKQHEFDFENQMLHLKDKLVFVQNAFKQFQANASQNKKEVENKIKDFEQKINIIRQSSENSIKNFEHSTRIFIRRKKQQIEKEFAQNKIIQEHLINQYQDLKKIVMQSRKKINKKRQEFITKYIKIEQRILAKCQQFKTVIKGQIIQMDQTQIQIRNICGKMRLQMLQQFQISKKKKKNIRKQIYAQIYELIKIIQVTNNDV